MAPRGKDLSTEQKQTIIKMTESGFRCQKISEIIGISANSIQKVIKRNAERGSVEKTERPGRKRVVGDRGNRVLSRLVKKNRRQTLSDLTDKFNESVPEKVSQRTVRRLKEQKYQQCSVSKKIMISKPNCVNRISWCRSKLRCTMEDNWKQVIFSDEMKVVLGKDRKIYMWRKPGERFQPDCLGIYGSHSPRSGISAMFWECLSFNGEGTLTEVE
jgi:transposase